MSELSPRARQLLRLSQKPPTLADRERIQNALRSRLGATTLPAAESSALPPTRSRWTVVSSAIVGAGLIGGALFLMTRHEPEGAIPARASVASAVATGSAVPAATERASSPVSLLPAAPASALPAPSARPAPDRLAQEVAFLERATSALHAGRASSALKVLDEYQREFPNGLLALERSAARAQALCALGRHSDAQVELSRLPSQSPAVARAKQVCDASSEAKR
jgi:hypothetical protein